MSTWLSTEELRLLELRHKTERDKRIADRIKAVLLFHKGWLHKEIAEALFIRIERVSRHIEEYRTATKLSPSNGGSILKCNEVAGIEKKAIYLYHENNTNHIRDRIAQGAT